MKLLILVNGGLFVLVVLLLQGGGETASTTASEETYSVEVKEMSKGLKASRYKSFQTKTASRERHQRLSARFFLPILGERNSITDLVDGAVIEKISRNVPVAKSYSKLLKEEDPEIKEDELKERVGIFKDITAEYLRQLYKIQRGIEGGERGELLANFKSDLNSRLALGSSGLSRLVEIEKESKSDRQLSVYEKILVKDKDKMSADQKKQLKELLVAEQTTLFDEEKSVDEHFQRSDRVLENVKQCLNSDQAEHFKYFQEYHWHSNDLPEVNDLPGMF